MYSKYTHSFPPGNTKEREASVCFCCKDAYSRLMNEEVRGGETYKKVEEDSSAGTTLQFS